MRWIYIVATTIPILIGMITTMSIMSIIIGPPVIKFGGGEPTLIIDAASITKVGNSYALILDVHNPGGAGVYIIGIKVNGKDIKNGPSFQNPLKIEGGASEEISYLIGVVKPVKNRYNITVLYVPETTQSIRATYIIIPAQTMGQAKT
jgi:hypothetical protein